MPSPIVPTSVPPLGGQRHESGYDGRYRLYTVEHLPFDALPAYADGGPATVVANGWCVSTSSLDRAFSSPSVIAKDDGMHKVSAFMPPTTWTLGAQAERHPLDGAKYPTRRDADRALYEAGLTAFMVYERDAARYGLPTAD